MHRVWLVVLLAGCLGAPDTGPVIGGGGPEAGVDEADLGLAADAQWRCDPCDARIAAEGDAFEPTIASHGDMIAVAFSVRTEASANKWNRLLLSEDAGSSWQEVDLGPSFDNFNELGDPVLAFTPDGRLVMATIALTKAKQDGEAVYTGFNLYVGTFNGTWDWTAVSPGIGVATTAPVTPVAYEANDRPFLDVAASGHITVGWTRITWNMPNTPDGYHAMTATDGGDGFTFPTERTPNLMGASVVTHNGTTWLSVLTQQRTLRVMDLASGTQMEGEHTLGDYPPYLTSTPAGLFVSARLENGTPVLFHVDAGLTMARADPVDVGTSPVNAPVRAPAPTVLYYADGAVVLSGACGAVTLADGITTDPMELGHYFGIDGADGYWVAWLDDDTSTVHVGHYRC